MYYSTHSNPSSSVTRRSLVLRRLTWGCHSVFFCSAFAATSANLQWVLLEPSGLCGPLAGSLTGVRALNRALPRWTLPRASSIDRCWTLFVARSFVSLYAMSSPVERRLRAMRVRCMRSLARKRSSARSFKETYCSIYCTADRLSNNRP